MSETDLFVHWADKVAADLIQKYPQKEEFVCASGISPSGFVHIGNFREVFTVDCVVRALKKQNKKVRFVYVWDDYDAFRKVPVNLPDPKKFEAHLRKPLTKVPDPFDQKKSYAEFFEKRFEEDLKQVGIFPSYLYQTEEYEKGAYREGVSEALSSQKVILDILNEFRSEPLKEWCAVTVYCKNCDRDSSKVKFQPPSQLSYYCDFCKASFELDFFKEKGAKLLWRVDWPMRWAKLKVDFEPGGKDHSSQGGSYDTGKKIVKAVWKKEPPDYLQYDFVLIKGEGSKLSSSKGNLIELSQALKVYEPSVVRYLFASRKPNLDFSIAFDLDVLKAYDDFDRTERIALKLEEVEPKKFHYEKRIYEMSITDPTKIEALSKDSHIQFSFRHLCNLLQICEGSIEKVKEHYSLKKNEDFERLTQRAQCAWNWLSTFAPEEFKFKLRDLKEVPKTKFPKIMEGIIDLLNTSLDETQLSQKMYDLIKGASVEPKTFFQDVYQILINKPHGPKLASFLLTIGEKRSIEYLKKSL